MSRTRKLKGLAAVSLILKTLNEYLYFVLLSNKKREPLDLFIE